MEFRDRLKALRKSEHLTQAELGNVLSYGHSAIANYESGRNEPSIADLKLIANHFHVSLDYLVGITDQPAAYPQEYVTEETQAFMLKFQQLDLESREELTLLLDWLTKKRFSSARNSALRVAQGNAEYGKGAEE